MDILWDEAKNAKLKASRGISFENVAQMILDKQYTAILENPTRPSQMIFVLRIKSYTYVVPFVVDENDNIVLKTVFPSRKFHRIYGRKKS